MHNPLAGTRYLVKVKEIAVVKTHSFKKSASLIRSAAKSSLIASAVAMTLTGAFAEGTDSSHTPSGAEVAGTASGIPAWTPVGNVGTGWTYGKRRADFFKYKSDKPLYTIDASNVDKYADKLNPGQIALLKNLKGFTMPVYPSRRTCGVPDFVAENTKNNVGFAKMSADGSELADAHLPGYPFPAPKTGAEVMWNAKLHYRGAGVEMRDITTAVSPRKGSSDWIRNVSDAWIYQPWGDKSGTTFAKVNQVEGNAYYAYKSPAAIAGQAAIFTTYAGKPTEVFYYFPGQRRTRRMPSYAYDAPQIGFDNQYNMDEALVFSGQTDRFSWKLLGKKEMIVTYNDLGMYDFSDKFEDAYGPDFVNPSKRRYELHRVWVVEATVKQGMRHTAPKRLFYVDEDSWSYLGAVDYDAQGNISKVREGYIIPVYETGSCDTLAFAQYNLVDGRYLVDGSMLAAGRDAKWSVDSSADQHYKPSFYNADNLRALSER
ncbi:DUF1329 domain-containing protein [Burkholderia sp. Bp9031]|nr:MULTISPECIES: DUF1329 domain-containing protein [Burkholderia]RQZ18718.1 DUF1329 domain-containing protein [Burkholderia sp. Bp9031]